MSSGKKAPVFISVYVVRPRRSTEHRRHHHHHHHHYHHVHQHVRGGYGYDRKAELLQYCHQLRASARREQASPAPKTKSNLTPTKIVPFNCCLNVARNPTCLGNWKRVLIPGFLLRSVVFRRKKEKRMTVNKMNDSIGNTVHAIAKSTRVEKQQGFVKKLLSGLRKHK